MTPRGIDSSDIGNNDMMGMESIITSILLTCIYVGVLYLPFNNSAPRDSRHIIVRRLCSLTIFTTLVELYVHYRLELPLTLLLTSTLTYQQHIYAFISSILLTLLLYSGHIIVHRFSLLQHNTNNIYMSVRNYIMAPLLEEIFFRRQTLLLFNHNHQNHSSLLLFSALMFALAHAHHARRLGFVVLAFQLTYTFLFGIYAAALYVRTDSVWGPYGAHVICNVLELPDFAAIAAHPKCWTISIVYAACVILFAVGFGPVTALVAHLDIHDLSMSSASASE